MFYLIKFADSKSHRDHMYIRVCFSPFRYLFILPSTCNGRSTWGGLGGFKPPQIF